MKTMKYLLLAIVVLGMGQTANAKKIIEYHKQGGLFGLFGETDQDYKGNDPSGNEHWRVDCSGIGTNRCKWKRENDASDDDPLMAFAAPYIQQMEELAEDNAAGGTLTGTSHINVARSTDGDSDPETLVIVTVEWTAETSEFNDGNIIITVNEVPYPL